MPYIETSVNIETEDIDKVYKIVSDMEGYSNFMENVNSVEVLERGEDYTITHWKTELKGKPFNWKEKDIFDPNNFTITYSLVEGDLKKFEGSWRLVKEGEQVKVTLDVDFEFGVPMIASLLNPIAKIIIKQNCDDMLTAIKQEIENSSVA
ncbi:SRPBCC family protein [Proteinivorax hydrogeniformans]|uniref:SRPBCC family protein n=1 Tax=Proteinivorax hydrogeniformans TaxID=1826727 RepID=A0AAU8HWV0_9FIRM